MIEFEKIEESHEKIKDLITDFSKIMHERELTVLEAFEVNRALLVTAMLHLKWNVAKAKSEFEYILRDYQALKNECKEIE